MVEIGEEVIFLNVGLGVLVCVFFDRVFGFFVESYIEGSDGS